MNLLKISGCYDHRVDDIDIGYNNEVTNGFEGCLFLCKDNYLVGTINNGTEEILTIGKFNGNMNLQLYFLASNHVIQNNLNYDLKAKKFIGTWKNMNCNSNTNNIIQLSLSGVHENSLETQLAFKVTENIRTLNKEALTKTLHNLSK